MKKPLVMFGDTRSYSNVELLSQRGWGRMFCQQSPTPFPFERWGWDNLGYKTWQDAGFPAGLSVDDWLILWDADKFDQRLRKAEQCGSDPYLAVCPDIPASKESLQFSLGWRLELPNAWPWYLAVQDGMIPAEVEKHLHMFAGIFLGGSDRFKLTAYTWARLAHRNGRRFHYARAGTPRKVRHAFAVQSDSLDSTFACWTKERTQELCAVWDGLGLQKEIWARA